MVTLLALGTLSHSHTWYVISSSNQHCPDVATCHKLSFYFENATKYFQPNTAFIFMTGKHILNLTQPIVISNMNNLILTGQKGDHHIPTIQCAKDTFGFTFKNISSIVVSTLQITNCGPSIHDSAITITSTKMARLSNLFVVKTQGIGVKLQDVDEVVISSSYFADNGLGVKNCSLESIKWWNSIHITFDDSRKVKYNISETIFKGNSQFEQIGGGLFINTINTLSTSVYIKGCQFRGINGCLVSGANITITEYNQSALVEISDSLFSNNRRIDVPNSNANTEIIGGALKIMTKQTVTYRYGVSHKIMLHNSSFLYNRASYCAGVGIIFSSINIPGTVVVKECHFISNIGEKRNGGMCIIPMDDITMLGPKYVISVSDSVFRLNEGPVGAALFIWPIWNGNYTLDVSLKSCSFEFNKIIDSNEQEAGIVSMWLSPRGNVTHSVTSVSTIFVSDCSFVSNLVGPGLCFTDTDLGSTERVLSIIVNRSTFINNTASLQSTGMIVNFTNTLLNFTASDCLFQNNTGSSPVIYIKHKLSFMTTVSPPDIMLTNVTVQTSKYMVESVRLVCEIFLIEITFTNVTIKDNEAAGMSNLNCALKFRGHNIIANNKTPFGGGGLTVNGTGYAYTHIIDSAVIFQNNTALLGGALYSSDETLTHTSLQVPCTFISLNAIFINDTATIGHNLYGGIMTQCVTGLQRLGVKTFYLSSKCEELPHSILQNNLSISSNPYSVYLCNVNDNTLLNNTNTSVSVFPGQSFNVSLVTTGYCESISPGPLKISSSSGIKVVADIQSEHTSNVCKMLYYTATGNGSKGNVTISTYTADQPSFVIPKHFTVMIHFSTCPYGMEVSGNGVCECNQVLSAIHVHCNISKWPYPILKSSGNNAWLAYNKGSNCTVVISDCPFDYCTIDSDVYFNLNDSTDRQCAYNRTGTLCGQCQEGLSLMLGSNACYKCTNTYLFLLMAFIIAGIVLVSCLITFNMTVSVGTINGLLFYVNIIKLNEAVFFPNGSIPVISHFISWMNLDFGFEVCFFNGLNGYWKTWLQFVFPFYVWLIAILIIIISRKSIRISQYLCSNIISVLATLILMSFTKILRNVTNALAVTKLHCDKYQEFVWSIDGNVNYMSIRHLVLVIFSSIILFIAVMYTSIIFFSQWLQRYSGKFCCSFSLFRLQPFLDAYTGPYRDKHRYWSGLLLLIRLALTFIFTFTSGSMKYLNNYCILLIEVVLILSFLSTEIYQSNINSLLERFFHINLSVLCLINSVMCQSGFQSYTSSITIVSIAISMLVFSTAVTQKMCSKCCEKKECAETVSSEVQPLLGQPSNVNDCSTYDVVVRQRDPIIFDLN